jgi:2-polyprenyl-6-methoxyphenol hydroxylase-like FAD-dependent oxidoreductase
MAPSTDQVAIIGAGLSGVSLALALHQQSIPCTIYESRPAPLNIGGAVMLSPNALKVLQALGVYERVRTKGYNFETLHYRDGDGKLLDTQEFGGEEKYGFKGLRIYRYVLIDELLAMIKESDIPVKYGMKFARIVSETEGEVTWEFADGSTHSASILVGADGIHSTVRRYLYPDLKPKFTGMAGITAAVPTAQLKLPLDYHIPVTIMTPHGGFVIAPQQVDGSEVLIGKQKRIEDHDRAGWDRVFADKEASVAFLRSDADKFPEIVQNAVSHIPHDKINIWPFYIVPKLDKWASERRRVIILGDAAHAIPPSAGQGINQAFEDIYMFALLLAQADKVRMEDALVFWQTHRQGRIDKVMELNTQIDLRRMPPAERAKMSQQVVEELELGWLFEPDFGKVVEEWVSDQNVKTSSGGT